MRSGEWATGAGRRVRHRPATGRRAAFAPDRLAGSNGRTPAADPDGVRRAGCSRRAVRHRRQPVPAVAVQVLDGLAGAILSVIVPLVHRRRHARHRSLQSRGRHDRRCHGSRRGAQHDGRRRRSAWPLAAATTFLALAGARRAADLTLALIARCRADPASQERTRSMFSDSATPPDRPPPRRAPESPRASPAACRPRVVSTAPCSRSIAMRRGSSGRPARRA